MSFTLTARRLLQSDGIVDYPVVSLENGRIVRIRGRKGEERPNRFPGDALDFPEATLVPAYLDIHVHGAAGHDVMEDAPDALEAIGRFLASRGVAAYLPTTVTSPIEQTLHALDRLADAMERPAAPAVAMPLGIHLEGPFLSHAKRGVHPPDLLRQPSVPLFEKFWQAARGRIRLMTIAPELPEALCLIEHASALGVVCSLGHSNAAYMEAEAGFDAGARSATHTFNAMRALGHRDPGVAAYVLDNEDLFAEIICDGIHVDPAMVRLFFRSKGPERSILVTDGIAATGMPDGSFRLGDLAVTVEKGRCTLRGSPGTLAGSVLTMDRAVANFSAFTGCGVETAASLAARNPARLLGLEDEWGALEEGREANLAVLTPAGELAQVFRAGQPIL